MGSLRRRHSAGGQLAASMPHHRDHVNSFPRMRAPADFSRVTLSHARPMPRKG
eukprot:CAMPEP_0170379930 /NCGR_PEP_ID=MMETSP0117_2-20130122/13597_1 /TAXON_ID=400756 /ORGANISM="Durinskia baltica, Strain CSIRO CS-38" /LENGTH=52 /DNA_ID=CAMNT_0010635385 /DNA_START=23 /DNA_END=178 /DNA_ORIENTATION=-